MNAPAPPDLHWLAALRERLVAIEPDMATDERLLFDAIDGQSDAADQLRAILRHGIEASVFAEALKRHMQVLEQRRARPRADLRPGGGLFRGAEVRRHPLE